MATLSVKGVSTIWQPPVTGSYVRGWWWEASRTPRSISNPHIRAHALEGQLFRSVLAAALKAHGLTCSVVLEREAYTKAATTLARSEVNVKRAVAALGRSLGGAWRAEEKLAAVARLDEPLVIVLYGRSRSRDTDLPDCRFGAAINSDG